MQIVTIVTNIFFDLFKVNKITTKFLTCSKSESNHLRSSQSSKKHSSKKQLSKKQPSEKQLKLSRVSKTNFSTCWKLAKITTKVFDLLRGRKITTKCFNLFKVENWQLSFWLVRSQQNDYQLFNSSKFGKQPSMV